MPTSDARQPTNAALEKLEGPLLRALATIPAAIWIADRFGLVVWMNVAATGLLGERTGPVAADVASVQIRDENGVIGVITLVRSEEPAADGVHTGPEPRLTPRQHQVLRLLAEGYSTTEMATALQISDQTVRNHVGFLLAELRVRACAPR
jgi:DNA-binding CsgD family transcriptional regulator